MNYEVIRLIDKPEIKEQAARWFHQKWGIPLEAYKESMDECLAKRNSVPQCLCRLYRSGQKMQRNSRCIAELCMRRHEGERD